MTLVPSMVALAAAHSTCPQIAQAVCSCATKVPYVDSPQLNAIRHAQVPGKIYLYIRRYRPKRTICFFAYIAGTAAVVGLSRELLLAGTIAGNTWTIT